MLGVSFGSLILALVLAEVTPWTIDLPEARKFIFEKNDRLEKGRHEQQLGADISKQVFLSNRYDSNSKHHDKPHDDDDDHDNPYAKDYGYQSYMEKKVRGVVYEGSEYLGGLQRSIESFAELLENCTRMNQTNERYRFNETAFNVSSLNAASFNSTPRVTPAPGPEPWRPVRERAPYNETNVQNGTERCRRVSRASEHVRRLAELAVKAARELQDIAYSRKHMKEEPHELSQQENELILKLAWFLDRLAYYTDFRPEPRRHLDTTPTSTSAAPPLPPVPNILNASDDTKRMMMNCLKQKSNVPATIRCAYPQEIPGVVQFLINNSNPMPGGIPSSSNRNERVLPPAPAPAATSEQELLIATDNRPLYLPYHHHLTAVRHVQKRSAPAHERREPRSAEDPVITFMKYFAKYKIWESSNPTDATLKGFEPYEINNDIHRIQRRAADDKKLMLPEDAFQDLSKYVKHKKGVNYVKDETQAQRIRASIQKIVSSKPSAAKEHSRRVAKLFRSKRSYAYERDVDEPRDPDDLYKDISYYVKNKPGTSFNRNLVQAAQVRAGLEQIFLIPNIATVRRYGSNFNPLIPDPLLFSSLRSAADN